MDIRDNALKFRRTVGMLALPSPVCSSIALRGLQQFLNIDTRDELVLVLTWLAYSFRAGTPYVILALTGPQGAGKSTIARILRSLIDPSDAALCAPARNARDLAICAPQSHVVTMDNVSEIRSDLSDALCRVATGGSHRERAYFTNNGTQAIHRFRNPILLNGIGFDHLPLRADLLDRMLLIPCEQIEGTKRQNESSLVAEFERKRPQFFAALLGVISTGLRNLDSVFLQDLPRMADFAVWGVAVEEALGFESGSFIGAYRRKIEHASDVALDASPIAWFLREFLKEDKRLVWKGHASELLKALIGFGERFAKYGHKDVAWLC